jgi:hypothetical protein
MSENENITLKHVQGKIGFMKYKGLPTTLEKALEYYTNRLPEWNLLVNPNSII